MPTCAPCAAAASRWPRPRGRTASRARAAERCLQHCRPRGNLWQQGQRCPYGRHPAYHGNYTGCRGSLEDFDCKNKGEDEDDEAGDDEADEEAAGAGKWSDFSAHNANPAFRLTGLAYHQICKPRETWGYEAENFVVSLMADGTDYVARRILFDETL